MSMPDAGTPIRRARSVCPVCLRQIPALKVLRGERVAHTYTGRDVWQGFEGMDL